MAGDISFFQRPRNAAALLYFPLATWSATDPSDNFNATPPTFVAGDVKLSKDGAAFANTTNLPTHVGLGIFSLVLTAAEMQADSALIAVQDAAAKVWKDRLLQVETFSAFAKALHSGTAQAGAVGSMTLSAEASAIDDFYNGAIAVIVGGTGVGQARVIRDYTGATKVMVPSENWITAPGATSVYCIIGGGELELTSLALADIWDLSEGAEPTGVIASTASFRSIIQHIKRVFLNRGTATNTARVTYKDDSITALDTQTFSNDGATQDRGKAG